MVWQLPLLLRLTSASSKLLKHILVIYNLIALIVVTLVVSACRFVIETILAVAK